MLGKAKNRSTKDKVTAVVYLLFFSGCLGSALLIVLSPLLLGVVIVMTAVAIDGETSYEEIFSAFTEGKEQDMAEQHSRQSLDVSVVSHGADIHKEKTEWQSNDSGLGQVIELRCVSDTNDEKEAGSKRMSARHLANGNSAVCSRAD